MLRCERVEVEAVAEDGADVEAGERRDDLGVHGLVKAGEEARARVQERHLCRWMELGNIGRKLCGNVRLVLSIMHSRPRNDGISEPQNRDAEIILLLLPHLRTCSQERDRAAGGPR